MSKDRINQLAIGLFILIIVGGFAWWFSVNFELESYTAREEMSAEARRNPLLAADRLLRRLGQQVESQSGRQFLIHPPEQPGVLLVRDLGAPLPQKRVEDLLAWVEAGGHLIASPGRLQDEDLTWPLQERFGVVPVHASDLEEDEIENTLKENEGDELVEVADTTPIFLPGDGQESLDVEFDRDTWFFVDYPDEYWQAPLGEAPHLLIFPLGKGFVTFLSDSDFFGNERIGDSDHASLLAELTAKHDRVWLLYSSQMPSLVQLLWRWAPQLVVSLGFLGLLLIWRMSRRSGPRMRTTQTQRRDLLEHLQAAAEFNWRIDPSAGFLRQARKQVEKRWLTSHPHLQRLDAAARCEWLAERTGMTKEQIDLALYQTYDDGGQMVKTTVNLQRLLAALHP
ncbi:MAG: DUF4350 domain-containing protein [Candidatus Thiodiazotropha sp.]